MLAQEKLSKFMSNVYMLMTLGLFVTGLIGYSVSTSPEFLSLIIDKEGFTFLGWFVLLSPLLIVLSLNFVMDKLGYVSGMLLFILFSILEGLSFSVIFLIYTESSILLTFSVTALTFLTMSIFGYITKKDLTNMGYILTMALFGMIITMVVNWFVGSETISYIISAIGVIVFTGLIAYDTQKLKNIASEINNNDEMNKMSVIGSLSLYLDFINLFLSLIRFLGDKK